MPMDERPLVEMRNILKIFGEGTPDQMVLFHDFNFSIRRGEYISVVGSNGSGKTTMLNILCGSLPIEGGQVLLDGKDPEKAQRTPARRLYRPGVPRPGPRHLRRSDGAGEYGPGR